MRTFSRAPRPHRALRQAGLTTISCPQIWDDFCAKPGNIRDGTSVADTCDHFRLFKEDIARTCDQPRRVGPRS